jgi:hypothetical protein
MILKRISTKSGRGDTDHGGPAAVGVPTNLPTGQAGRNMVNEIFSFRQLLRKDFYLIIFYVHR